MNCSDEGESWRQYADDLTPEQIANYEENEVRLLPEYRDQLVDYARNDAECNRMTAQYADLPVPPGSELRDQWFRDLLGDGSWCRTVRWAEYATGMEDAEVEINGLQKTDGTYTRRIALYVWDNVMMTSKQTRILAEALLKAADDLDRG